MRRLADAIGCGSNPKRIRDIMKRRRSTSLKEIIEDDCVLPPHKIRKDKISGHPVFTSMWHHVCPCHKGQSEVSKCVETKRFKCKGKYRTESKWLRHQLRVMQGKIEEILQLQSVRVRVSVMIHFSYTHFLS